MAVVTQHGTAGALISLIWLLVVACGDTGEVPVTNNGQAEPLRVVTTTALLADLVKNVGGDLVAVTSIIPPGADLHSFQTTPEDSVAISRARVIVTNGFGLDAFLEPVLRGAIKMDATQVVAAEGLDASPPRKDESQEGGHGANNLDEQGQSQVDPHFWQNPEFAIHYVKRIRDGLASADPVHKPEYEANAESYIEELEELDREIAQTLARVPLEHRHLVTFHDAFSHFGLRYGWKVSAFVDSDGDEVAPADVVRVLDRVKKERLPAVFVEPQVRSGVIQRAANDAGVPVRPIYSDIARTGVTSYTEMMRFNARTLAEHLR